METLGPFKGVYRDYKVVYRDQGHIMSYSLTSLKGGYIRDSIGDYHRSYKGGLYRGLYRGLP